MGLLYASDSFLDGNLHGSFVRPVDLDSLRGLPFRPIGDLPYRCNISASSFTKERETDCFYPQPTRCVARARLGQCLAQELREQQVR
jgi:hypothetical protein